MRKQHEWSNFPNAREPSSDMDTTFAREDYLGALVIAEAQLELCLTSSGVLTAHACIAGHAAQCRHQLGLLVQPQPVLNLASHCNRTLHAQYSYSEAHEPDIDTVSPS